MASLDDLSDDVSELKVSVARIEERQEALRLVVKEAVREALAPTHARLDSLEKDISRAKAYGAAVAALATAAAWVAEHWPKVLPVILSVVGGCAADPVEGRSWPESLRPVGVLIPSDMEEGCVDAAHEAVDWWLERIDYLAPLATLTFEKPRLGEISIRQGELPEPHIGFAEWSTGPDGGLQRATITLESCDAQTAAHELGHALGLDHVDDVTNLMYPSLAGGWQLTAEQLKQVR